MDSCAEGKRFCILTRIGLFQAFMYLAFCLTLTSTCTVLHAQGEFDKGFTPYRSYQSFDIDSVNLDRGSLTLHIPLLSYPQMGHLPDLRLFISGNSLTWYPKVFGCGPSSCSWQWYPSQNPSLGTPFYNTSISSYIYPYRYYDGYYTYHAYHIVDPDGGSHPLGWTSPTTMVAIDGSGYGNGFDRAGNCLNSACDKNGNKITVSSSGITDSVGRLIPQSSSTVGSCNTAFYPGPDNSSVPYVFCYQSLTLTTSFGISGIYEYTGELGQPVTVLQSITLPNNTQWLFTYYPNGDLKTITLPTGATISYTYVSVPACDGSVTGPIGGFAPSPTQIRSVSSRSIDLHDGSSPKTWLYSYPYITSHSGTVVTDPGGSDTVHIFTEIGGAGSCSSYETQTRYYTGPYTGSTLVRTDSQQYTSGIGNPFSQYDNYNGNVGILPTTTTTTLANGQVKQTVLTYDTAGGQTFYDKNDVDNGFVSSPSAAIQYPFSYGDALTKAEYDYGNGLPGPLLRQTNFSYEWQSQSSYVSANLIDRLCLTTTYSPGSVPSQSNCTPPSVQANQVSQVTYAYDEAGSPQGVYGNQTSEANWVNTGGSRTLSSVFNTQGMVTIKKDALMYPTTISYQCSGSLPYQVTNALNQTTTYGYDCNTGLMTSVQDANGQTTSYTHTSIGDLQSISYPDGGTVNADYHGYSVPLNVTTTTTASPNPSIVSSILYDYLGRPSVKTAPDGTTSEMTYDALGRLYSVANFHSGTSTTGTTYWHYDVLGRVTQQTQQDGSNLWWCYDGVQTNSQPNCNNQYGSVISRSWIDSTDESGHHSQHTSDALGRLTNVVEPNGAMTVYGYNALNDLTSVIQQGTWSKTLTTRSFSYDSLSRLITSSNPESGTICYGIWSGSNCVNGYDSNGNLSVKTDARNVTTNYGYDALNRLISKSGPGMAYSYTYDAEPSFMGITASNAIGRLVWETNGVNADRHYSYDAMGRVTYSHGCTWSVCGPGSEIAGSTTANTVRAVYDQAGNLTDLTYPNGYHIKQTWDSAGRLAGSALIDINGTARSQNYLQSATYYPDGTPSTLTLGNGVEQAFGQNPRLQVSSIRVGPEMSSFLSHTYCYMNCINGGGGTANNGNIWQIKDNKNSSLTQDFTYDALNRITRFSLGGTAYQDFIPDSVGNSSPAMPNGSAIFNFDPATNRISNLACANYVASAYDSAGNQLCDTDSNGAARKYTYDAESRINAITMVNSNQPFETYDYQPNGDRARKTGQDGSFTEYVNFGGQTLAEKNSDGSWTNYIYANGRRIARADARDIALHLHETSTCSNCGTQGLQYFLFAPVGYTVKAGDKLSWRQYQSGTADGGVTNIWFWQCGGFPGPIPDTDGNPVQNGISSNEWHQRTLDMTQYAGCTIQTFGVGAYVNSAGDGDIWYADMAITSSDGTVLPIVYRNNPVPSQLYGTSSSSITNLSLTVDSTGVPLPPSAIANYATTFYAGDHLGTAQMELSTGGWPVWKGTFSPHGQELSTLSTPNHYKFTGKERDTESGLDYFGARFYASSMGRFMSPDPISIAFIRLVNPQRLNKYAYAINKPLTYVDIDGREAIQFRIVADIPSRMTYFPAPAMGGTKLVHTFTVETDPNKSPSGRVEGGESKFVGASTGVGATGGGRGTPACLGWCSGQASDKNVGTAINRSANGDVEVDLDDKISYPLLPSPDIDITMAIVIKKNGDIMYNGKFTQFPRISIFQKREGGQWSPVNISNPWQRSFIFQTPLWLLFGQTKELHYKVTSHIVPVQ